MKVSFLKPKLFDLVVLVVLAFLVVSNHYSFLSIDLVYYKLLVVGLILALSVKIRKCGSAEAPPTLD